MSIPLTLNERADRLYRAIRSGQWGREEVVAYLDEYALAAEAEAKRRGDAREGERICACGHRARFHLQPGGGSCLESHDDDGNEWCVCEKFRPSPRSTPEDR